MYLTNFQREDGFGAQYQTIIFSILYCELENLEFVYTPFSKMEHNYESDPLFIQKKEELINLIDKFKLSNQVNYSETVRVSPQILYRKVEDNLDYCLGTESFNLIKKSFFENKPKKELSSGQTLSLHIRRPNMYDIGDYGYTEDNYFLRVIDTILDKNSDIEKIKIYSQGSEELFKNFSSHNIEYHLNESIEQTFTDLVMSDILVMSKGSFSYTAGLLSRGEVYYLPFWHKPKKTWIKL
jgi:hypothetical protein